MTVTTNNRNVLAFIVNRLHKKKQLTFSHTSLSFKICNTLLNKSEKGRYTSIRYHRRITVLSTALKY